MHTFETTSPDKSMIEKIRKLLALADSARNSHENERNVAMQAAMDLLAKHNLSMSQVNSAKLEISIEEMRANFKLEPWIRVVISAACELYYTNMFIDCHRNWNGRLESVPVFIGTMQNVAVTIEMTAWFIHSIRKESNSLYKDAYARRSFRVGAADRILSRACDITAAEKAKKNTNGSGTSLVVLRNQLEKANEAHLATKNLKYSKPRPLFIDGAAYADGQSFGDQVGLNRQVNKELKRLPQFSH